MTYDLFKSYAAIDSSKEDFYMLRDSKQTDLNPAISKNDYKNNNIVHPFAIFHKKCFIDEPTLLQRYVDFKKDIFDPVHSYFYCQNCDNTSFDLHELSKMPQEQIGANFVTTLFYSILNKEYKLQEVHTSNQIYNELVLLSDMEMRVNLVKNFTKLRSQIKC
jgi:hypothetical protein